MTDVGQEHFSYSQAPRYGGLRLSFSALSGWENVFPRACVFLQPSHGPSHGSWRKQVCIWGGYPSLVCFSLSLFSFLCLPSLLLPSLSFGKHLEILISHPPVHQLWGGRLCWAGWAVPPPVPFLGSPCEAAAGRFSAPPRSREAQQGPVESSCLLLCVFIF